MTAQTTVFALSPVNALPTASVRLERHEQHRLPNAALRLRVTQGIAWITSQGQDVVLHAGESLDIPRQRFAAVVSTAGAAPTAFEVQRR